MARTILPRATARRRRRRYGGGHLDLRYTGERLYILAQRQAGGISIAVAVEVVPQ
jgi:hypothetical protein